MIIKKLILKEQDSSEGSEIRKFIEGMYSHPLYASIIQQLRKSEGFVKKINTLKEDKYSTEFINEIYFENQETFDKYFNDPSVKNLYEYLEMLLQSDNIEIIKEIDQN